jgi:hypothetical protein
MPRERQRSSTASCTNWATISLESSRWAEDWRMTFVVGCSCQMSHCGFRLQMDYRSPAGFDRTRNVIIGNKNFELSYLEEAYTTEHWLVRIYKWVRGCSVRMNAMHTLQSLVQ